MVALWQPEGFIQDRWRHLTDVDDCAAGPLTVTWNRWQRAINEADGWSADTPLGVRVPQDIEATQLGPVVHSFNLVVVVLELPEDGRHYSMVRQLRDRYQYSGPIRATGEVAVDQLGPMLRCGYSEFLLENPVSEHFLNSVLHRNARFDRRAATK